MFVMQTSAMKTCFQIAECNFSFAKLCNISVTSKYLNEINFIIGLIILNLPSCFASGMRNFSSVYSPALHGKRQGLYATMNRWRIDPSPPLYVSFMFQKCNRLRWATKLTSLGNEAYFISQRSLLRFLMRFLTI